MHHVFVVVAMVPLEVGVPPVLKDFDLTCHTKDMELGTKMTVAAHGEIKKGYDLVRWGNLGDVAFFHARTEEVSFQDRLDCAE